MDELGSKLRSPLAFACIVTRPHGSSAGRAWRVGVYDQHLMAAAGQGAGTLHPIGDKPLLLV